MIWKFLPNSKFGTLQRTPLQPHNEKEFKATPLGCEPENSVEEKATIVSLHEEDEDEMPRYDVICIM